MIAHFFTFYKYTIIVLLSNGPIGRQRTNPICSVLIIRASHLGLQRNLGVHLVRVATVLLATNFGASVKFVLALEQSFENGPPKEAYVNSP